MPCGESETQRGSLIKDQISLQSKEEKDSRKREIEVNCISWRCPWEIAEVGLLPVWLFILSTTVSRASIPLLQEALYSPPGHGGCHNQLHLARTALPQTTQFWVFQPFYQHGPDCLSLTKGQALRRLHTLLKMLPKVIILRKQKKLL